MVRPLGLFYGISFTVGGVLGFVPGVTEHEMFLGIFMVNPLHSALHVASGVIFLIASMVGAWAARLWFQIFGAGLWSIGGDGLLGRRRDDFQSHHQQSKRQLGARRACAVDAVDQLFDRKTKPLAAAAWRGGSKVRVMSAASSSCELPS